MNPAVLLFVDLKRWMFWSGGNSGPHQGCPQGVSAGMDMTFGFLSDLPMWNSRRVAFEIKYQWQENKEVDAFTNSKCRIRAFPDATAERVKNLFNPPDFFILNALIV